MSEADTLKFLEQLRSIAQQGLAYSRDSFDRARFSALLDLAASEYSPIAALTSSSVRSRFEKELGHVTPKVGVNAAIFDGSKLLLGRRSDDRLWELPGGWAELGESPRDCLQREMREELSLEVQPEEIIEVFHRLPGDFDQPHTTYHLLFHCRHADSIPQLSDEVVDFGYFDIDAVSDWHRDHGTMARRAVDYVARKAAGSSAGR